MINLNTRQWSTPIVIAAGLFMSVSGVMMFFGVHRPVTLAHEWIGLAFVTATVFHISTHWRGFKSYFSQRAALAIVGAVAVVTCSLILLSASREDGEHHGHRMSQESGRAGPGFESLVGALHPDHEQGEKIRAILDDEATQVASTRHATHQRILTVLSDAQRRQYENLIQQQVDLRLHRMTDALNLTQAQQDELGAILMLADDRFEPSIAGSDLTEAVQTILNDEQVRKLATLSREDRSVGDL